MIQPNNNVCEDWKCTSCSSLNKSNRNNIPCKNCHSLESDINLKRARELYILGNIRKPLVRLIPLAVPFFIYPLSPPIVKYTTKSVHHGIWINFHIELWDTKHIENYHIQYIKIDRSKPDKSMSSSIINNKTPYNHSFSLFMDKPIDGVYTFQICAKCAGSNKISPKTLFRFYYEKTKKFENLRYPLVLIDDKKEEIESNTYKLMNLSYDSHAGHYVNDDKISEYHLNHPRNLLINNSKCYLSRMNKEFEENEQDWITFKINSVDEYNYYPISVSIKSCHEPFCHNIYFSAPKTVQIECRGKSNKNWLDLFGENIELERKFGTQSFEINEKKSKDYFQQNPIEMVRISLIHNHGENLSHIFKFVMYEFQIFGKPY